MLSDVRHLARRFVFSLRPGAPEPADEAWLLGLLRPAEVELYEAQPLADRTHSVRCAVVIRDQRQPLPGTTVETAAVASALHDVGKTEAGLGTAGRVVATVLERVIGRHRVTALRERSGVVGRIGRYADHDRRGGELLAAAGASDLAVAWAIEHHWPPESCTIDATVAQGLREADNA